MTVDLNAFIDKVKSYKECKVNYVTESLGGRKASLAIEDALYTCLDGSIHVQMAVQNTTNAESAVVAKSSYVEEVSLQPFLQATFDPADYLNATLPILTFSNAARDAQATRESLAELTTRAQSLMSQLNAQTSRLSNTLNQLTDDILRSGSRLAYEVDILRGETVGLSDALNEGLKNDIAHFMPDDSTSIGSREQTAHVTDTPNASEPEYIDKLRTLTKVRARLESVIQIFGEAMQWPLAPSELSVASSLISVSAPSAGGSEASRDLEDKGRDYTQKLRSEIQDLLDSAGNTEQGIEAAMKKIEEQRVLAAVWRGTAEEKARLKIVESLTKPVEDEQKELARKSEAKRRTASPSAGVDYRYGEPTNSGRPGGYGFIKNLQKLKDDIYMD